MVKKNSRILDNIFEENEDAVFNDAGGRAYKKSAKEALAQYAATGSFGQTFYSSPEEQLEKILYYADMVDEKYLMQLAIYSREHGRMKDMPAFLGAVITAKKSQKGLKLLARNFDRVINNGKMLRNYVDAVRSGKTTRKSFGTGPRRIIRNWIKNRKDYQLFRDSIGNNPSMADIIKMVHPKPFTEARSALYAYLINKPYEFDNLPQIVKDFELYKQNKSNAVPDVPFEMLTSLNLGTEEWTEIAKNAKWHMTRMNLNTFARHGVFKDTKMCKMIADRLKNPDLIKSSGNFPYQIFTTFKAISANLDVPLAIVDALCEAANIACDNVPEFPGKIYICLDVSSSMHHPVMRQDKRGRIITPQFVPKCIDVAALLSSAILRKNPKAVIIPFATTINFNARVSPKHSIMHNAQNLADSGGGGTNCAAPLEYLNEENAVGDLVIYISDDESWIDSSGNNPYTFGTRMYKEWKNFRNRNPSAKLICIDVTPHDTSQVPPSSEIINVGGFSDFVFDLIQMILSGNFGSSKWVDFIESIEV